MLRWLHEQSTTSTTKWRKARRVSSLSPKNATIDEHAAACAAENGHLHVLEFLIQQSEKNLHECIQHAFSSAISAGQLHVVQYLDENDYECWDDNINKAVENGHVDVARYVLENRIGLDSDDALDRAAERGHLEVVELLCANG
ncbi:hypothetical protein PybrP1_007867 [[Pythium] brassicae (nom. inval.)]|nr:hypothetical protein PybrP1_007867 [[Pythium] brassicae (nom. inval.)]